MKNKAHTISVVNQKGGVGKTTTSVNLSSYLANLGKKTLLVDLDPQANATSGIGIDVSRLEHSLYDILLQQVEVSRVICPTVFDGLHVLPATKDLAGAEVELVNLADRETYLKAVLEPLYDYYDYIIIDCPPSLGLLTINALVASTKTIIPVQCEYYALEGIAGLVNTLNQIKDHYNPVLEIAGIVLTMFDRRTALNKQVVENTRRFFQSLVFDTVVPRNIRLSEAPSHGIPIVLYNSNSTGAIAYSELTKEVVNRVEN